MKNRMSALALIAAIAASAAPAFAAKATTPPQATVTITVRPPGTILGNVVAMIEEQSGANIVLAPDAASLPVRYLNLENVSVAAALQTLEKAYNLVETKTGTGSNASTILGQASTATIVTQVVAVPAGGAADLSTYAQARYGTSVTVNAPDTTHVIVSGPSTAVDDIKHVATELATDDFGLDRIGVNTKPEDILNKLHQLGLLPTDMAVQPDDDTASIYVVGTKTARDAIRAAIRQVDIAPDQLYFTVTVVDETPQDDSSNIGVEWGQPVTDQSTGTTGINIGSTVTTFANRVIPIGAQLNLMLQKGTAKVLTQQKLSLLNNDTAELQVGSNYPIVTTSTGLLNGNNVQFYKIGVLLQISSHVGADQVATIHLTSTYSDLGAIAQGTDIPQINTRYATSSLRVKNGDVIVQAGYFRDADSTTISKIPGLGDIPIIGTLFKDVVKTRQREELVFIITPHIGALTPVDATRQGQ